MSYMIWGAFIFLGMIKSESKIVNALQKTWVVVMWGMANDISDIDSYQNHFWGSMLDCTPKHIFLEEGIYRNFCWLIRTLGIGFNGYLFLLAVFSVLAIDKTMDYFEVEQKGFVWAALMLFPIYLMGPALQGRLAFCVVLLGLRFLEKFNFKNLMLFLLFVILAGCIHTGAYEYLILLVVYIYKEKRQAPFITGGLIACEVLFMGVIREIIVSFNVDGFRAIDTYFVADAGIGRAVGHVIMYICIILLASYGYTNGSGTERNNLLHKIMWGMTLGYPLIFLSTQLRRNLEPMFLIPYMCIASNEKRLYNPEDRKLLKIMTGVAAAVIYVGLHIRNFEQFRFGYIQTVINGNYVSQGQGLWWRMIIMILIFAGMIFMECKFSGLLYKRDMLGMSGCSRKL